MKNPIQFRSRIPSDYPNSRYGLSEEVTQGNRVWLALPDLPPIPAHPGDVWFTVTEREANRPDKIAWMFYRKVSLYWIIAHANQILNPLDIPVGALLRIPPLSSLYGEDGILL